jgi:peptide-methionine (S)-S-oxide reductase
MVAGKGIAMKLVKLLVFSALLAAPANAANTETAMLAGGCYWGMQEVFEHVKGVTGVVAGFGRDSSGPVEAVKITYDPSQITYNQLLEIYFTVAHDPTQVNRQGPDVGPNYRSAIFPQSPSQAQIAQAFISQLSAKHVFKAPIATRMEQGSFQAAERDQQDFAKKHPDLPYIVINDVPKVKNLRKFFPELYRS